MFQEQQNVHSRRHFRHPLLTTVIGIVVGCAVIAAGSWAIYSSKKHVVDCKRPQIHPLYFMNGTFDKTTMVSMCRTSDTLIVEWSVQDSKIINNYKNCHDPIYKGDSVGVMLKSPLYRYVNNYYTFIISPTGLVYSQDISPYYQTHSHIFDCDDIEATVSQKQQGWTAKLEVPVDKIGKGYIMATEIINFFRVDVDQNYTKTISFSDRKNLETIQNYIVDNPAQLNVKHSLQVNSI